NKMMKTNTTITKVMYFALWGLFLIVFEFFSSFIRYYNVPIDNIASFVKYFVLTLVVLRIWKKEFNYYFAAFNLFHSILIFIFLYGYFINDKVIFIAWTN